MVAAPWLQRCAAPSWTNWCSSGSDAGRAGAKECERQGRRPPGVPRVSCSPRRPPISPLPLRAARATVWRGPSRRGWRCRTRAAPTAILGICKSSGLAECVWSSRVLRTAARRRPLPRPPAALPPPEHTFNTHAAPRSLAAGLRLNAGLNGIFISAKSAYRFVLPHRLVARGLAKLEVLTGRTSSSSHL